MQFWYWYKDKYINKRDRIKSPKTNLYTYGQLMMQIYIHPKIYT